MAKPVKCATFCENSGEAFNSSVTHPLRQPKLKSSMLEIWSESKQTRQIGVPLITFPFVYILYSGHFITAPQIALWRALCKSEKAGGLPLLHFGAALTGAQGKDWCFWLLWYGIACKIISDSPTSTRFAIRWSPLLDRQAQSTREYYRHSVFIFISPWGG